MDVLGRRFSRPEEGLQPGGALATGADFAASQKIALRNDTDEMAGVVGRHAETAASRLEDRLTLDPRRANAS